MQMEMSFRIMYAVTTVFATVGTFFSGVWVRYFYNWKYQVRGTKWDQEDN